MKPMSQNKFFTYGDTKNSSNNVFRKTSVVCASPNSLPRVPAISPALSEGKAESFRHDKSPSKSMASYVANWRTFSQMAKYGELAKIHTSEMDRKKDAGVESRKRKSIAQHDIFERKLSKPDNASQQILNSPANAYHRHNPSPPELQRIAPKTSSTPHQLMSLYDSFCTRCQAPHVVGANCIDPLKSASLQFQHYGNPSANAYPLYAHMLMSASRNPASSIDSQFVCNWVNPASGTCGKRFGTADELSTHLRTHVNAIPSNVGVSNFINSLEKITGSPYAAYLSQAAALAAIAPMPNAIGSNLLSRSHSPVNSYPYKAAMLSHFTSSLPPLSIPAGVGPYSSPYGLFNPKLNPAASAGFCYP